MILERRGRTDSVDEGDTEILQGKASVQFARAKGWACEADSALSGNDRSADYFYARAEENTCWTGRRSHVTCELPLRDSSVAINDDSVRFVFHRLSEETEPEPDISGALESCGEYSN